MARAVFTSAFCAACAQVASAVARDVADRRTDNHRPQRSRLLALNAAIEAARAGEAANG
jgi:hypothetical protein